MSYTTINKSTDYFNTLIYTGTGSSSTKSGVGFQPDLTWVKARGNTTWHYLYDAVRTAGSDKEIHSNSNQAQGASDGSTYGYLSAFTSDGFSTVMGSNTGSDGFNKSGTDFVAWNWKANGSGSSNSNGSVTSTVSANTTAGLSICKFTFPSSGNFTVGHGLGVAPDVVLMKGLGTANWQMYHSALGNTYNTQLNYTNAASSAANWWGSTSPTSTVFTVGSDLIETGQDGIAYCFAEKKGYSKFGSYTGNGNADGTFVYTGFKPFWVMWKKSSGTEDWGISDNKRDTINVMQNKLRPNSNIAEVGSQAHVDYLSNGFKWRSTSGEFNNTGDTYIYMAFGQSLVGSNNVPCTAR
tara:strand:- start:1203 stop:2258 length:1056 start_codon:yes stop_codon:yes gene_type:complete